MSDERPRLKALNLKDFLDLEIKPREQVLDPIIQTQSTNMLFAKRGVGKTYMGAGIGLAVAGGISFLRWKAPTPRKVLYIDGEMPAITMQDRITDIQVGMKADIDPRYWHIVTPDVQDGPMPSLSNLPGQMMVEDLIGEFSSELIILDNISTLTTGGRENDAESWLSMQQWILSLRKHGISVLLVHHAGRNGEQRGTSRREDVLDTMITLRNPENYKTSEGIRFEVHFTKARNLYGPAAEPFEVQMHSNGGGAIWTMGECHMMAEMTGKEKMIEALKEGPMSYHELAVETGENKGNLKMIRSRYQSLFITLDDGRIQLVG